jgi:hypothetical protein
MPATGELGLGVCPTPLLPRPVGLVQVLLTSLISKPQPNVRAVGKQGKNKKISYSLTRLVLRDPGAVPRGPPTSPLLPAPSIRIAPLVWKVWGAHGRGGERSPSQPSPASFLLRAEAFASSWPWCLAGCWAGKVAMRSTGIGGPMACRSGDRTPCRGQNLRIPPEFRSLWTDQVGQCKTGYLLRKNLLTG